MKLLHQAIILSTALSFIGKSNAFAPSIPTVSTTKRLGPLFSRYVPDGLTPEQYLKIKANDEKKLGKGLGRLGPRGFKSRSLQAWQEAYERGESRHLFSPVGYRKQLKTRTIKQEDVPYMLRPGGSWDNSDVKGARRAKWSKTDKDYAQGGYKKEQSVSILGSGPGFNWTGEKKQGPGKRSRWAFPGMS